MGRACLERAVGFSQAGGGLGGRGRAQEPSPQRPDPERTDGLLLASKGRVGVWVSLCSGGGKVGRSPGIWWLESKESSSQMVALVNTATRIFLNEKVALGIGFRIAQWVGSGQCPGKKIVPELTTIKADC